jgi:hypothetical protein
VEIDAYSGEVSGFYKDESSTETGSSVSRDQALQIARQAIKKYSPGKETCWFIPKLLIMTMSRVNTALLLTGY